jgi:MFS family permease
LASDNESLASKIPRQKAATTMTEPSEPDKRDAGILSADQLLTLYFPAFIFALGYSIATPAIPVLAKSFDTGFGVASLVIVVHALGGLMATVPSGFLLDHLGRRPVLLGGPLLMAASSWLTATARSFPELLVYRLLGGAAMEMWRQARLAIIADVARRSQRGRQMSGMVAIEGAGRLIGPAAGGFLAAWSIRVPFVVHGFLALAAILPSFFMLRESAPVTSKPRSGEAPLDTRAVLALIADARYRGFFCAQFFASMTRGVLWGGTLLFYATYAYGVGAEGLGWLATVSTVVGLPITFSAGFFMDRFGRKMTMVPGFVLIALGLLFLASSAQWQWSVTSFVVGFLWIHGGQALTAGSMQVLGSDMAPAHARGRFFGFWRLIGEVGGLISPALFGFIADRLAYSAAFFLFSFCSLATASLLTFSVQETVGKRNLASIKPVE